MVARFARGRLCATCAVGLLAFLTGAAAALDARAQPGDAEWQSHDEFALGDSSEFDDFGYGCDGGNSCGCGDACCDGSHMQEFDCGCSGFSSGRNWWFNADYLLWRISGTDLPPLLTDSPVGTEPVLGLTTTSVISGAGTVGNDWRSGYRLGLGFWLDECNGLAISGDYFSLGDDDYDFYYAGDSGRNTGRPYLDTQTGLQAQRQITGPIGGAGAVYDGTVSVSLNDDFQGAGLSLERCLYSVGDSSGYGPSTQVIVLGGYRYYSYDSRLAIDDSRTVVAGAGLGDVDAKHDRFLTDNEFHGAEIGVGAKFTQTGCWFDGTAKVALGGQRSSATINGETISTPANSATTSSEGGLLTSSDTNIGFYADSRVRFIPQFRFGFGAFITPNWTARAGYNVVIWDGVARPAGQMPPNLAVDPRNIPPVAPGGGAAPVFPGLGRSELVAHGLDLGIEYRY